MPNRNSVTNNWLQLPARIIRHRWRISIALTFVIAITLILPKDATHFYDYQVGSEWTESDLIAPFDFPIVKDPQQFKKETESVITAVPPVFLLVPNVVEENRKKLNSFFSTYALLSDEWTRFYANTTRTNPNTATPANDLNARMGTLAQEIERPTIIAALQTNFPPEKIKAITLSIFDSVYTHGLIDKKLADFSARQISLRESPSLETLRDVRLVFDLRKVENYIDIKTESQPASITKLISKLIFVYCKPNYIFDEHLYNEEQTNAISEVSRFYGKIKQNDKIIGKGEKITKEIGAILASLNVEREMRAGEVLAWYRNQKVYGQFFIITIIVIIVVAYLRKTHERIYTDYNRFALLFSIYFIMAMVLSLAHYFTRNTAADYDINFFYAVPLCIAPIMITVFFDSNIGLFTNIIMALLAALINQNSFEYFFTQTIVGTITVLNIKDSRFVKRSQIFYLAGWIFFAYVVVNISHNFYTKGSLEKLNYNNLFLFLINVLFTLATYPLIFFFERIYGVTSNITLIELLDINHPLLVSLYEKAPGTFQHSLQVANIAEEAARSIKADPLLAHVGALYHDIGKVHEPQYFTENIDKQAENPHKKLTPDQSAQKIIEHVTRGFALGQEYRLPPLILEFIQVHHGTTRVESFYRQYLSLHPEAVGDPEIEQKFRYKGGLPKSKETTIVMMADSVEAASRSLDNPTKEDLEKLIENIVAGKINDQQFIESPLTFKELLKVKKEMLQVLISIHHNRTKYPGQVGSAVRPSNN